MENTSDKVVEFGTNEITVKEFMNGSEKGLIVLSDYDQAKANLLDLKTKFEARVNELVKVEILSTSEINELSQIRRELREPRYLLQNIQKNNISVFEGYKKNDKAKLNDLIALNESLESLADEKIKAEETRKKEEKEAELRKEQERIDGIKRNIDKIESDAVGLIQSMSFEKIKDVTESVETLINTDFDFEEFDILFEQMKSRVVQALLDKTNDIKDRENQRLENIRLKDEADKREAEIAKEKAEREANEKEQKQKMFEIRKNRLAEIHILFDVERDYFRHSDGFVSLDKSEVFEADAIDFETIISDAKNSIAKEKSRIDQEAAENADRERLSLEAKKKAEKENKSRQKRLANDKEIISKSFEVYFADLHLDTDNIETKEFIERANAKVLKLKNELLTELNEL